MQICVYIYIPGSGLQVEEYEVWSFCKSCSDVQPADPCTLRDISALPFTP